MEERRTGCVSTTSGSLTVYGGRNMTLITDHASEKLSFDLAKARCTNPNRDSYHRYGGAGVTFHEGWLGRNGFASFFAHIGPKPTPAHTIDRIENSKGYEPGNVKWSTKIEQNRNRSNTKLAPEELNYVRFISDMFQISYGCIRLRYVSGITNPTDLQAPPRVRATSARTLQNREDVTMLHRRGMSRIQIAKRLGLNLTTVSDIVKLLGL